MHSLKVLRDVEYNRLSEAANKNIGSCVVVEDASTVCSNEDFVDLEALNLICSDIAEGVGDGGCDSLHLQTPISHKIRGGPRSKKKIKIKF